MRQNINSCEQNSIKRTFITALFLIAFAAIGFAQNPLLGIGNKTCDMTDGVATIITQPLPTPPPCCGYNSSYFYDGSVSSRQQTVQFDQYGELLFFIVDGAIYDKDGYLIAKAGNCSEDLCEPCLWNESHQVIVTPYPGMCDRFIIIRNFGSQLLFSFLDFSLPNCHFPYDRHGALIGSNVIGNGNYPELDFYSNNFVNVDFIDNYSFIFDPFDDVKPGTLHMDLIEQPNNEGKLLFVVHQGEYAILEIIATDIHVLSTFQFTSGTYERFEEGECEIGFDFNTNEYLVAFTTAEANYYEPDLPGDANVNLVVLRVGANGTVNDIHGYQPAFVPNQEVNKHIAGLEFSPNGQYLYFSQHREPMVGYISLADGLTHAMPFTIANISNFENTRIEGNKTENSADNAIYFLGNDNTFAAISGSNNPTTSTWISNVNTSLSIGTVPYFYGYSTEQSNFKSLQTQTFNAPEIVNFLSSQGCCVAHTNVIGIQGMTITTDNDGTWTYGNNPFNNSMVPVRIVDDLIFEPGTITNISNMVIEFGADANMIMKAGSKVSLNGSTLTSISCASIMWPGINLLGTTNTTNSIDQSPMSGGDQGYLYMNNSTIEHATRAVEVGILAASAGGIIRANNSTFRNNQYDVIFKKYHFINSGGYYVQNKSLFNNCIFITDTHLNNPLLSPGYHAWLTEVDKINFTNCSFMNKTDISVYNWFQRGTGIFSSRASFTVDGLNDSWTGSPVDLDQTTFYKLCYGIRSFGYNNPLSFYTCKQQEFQFCLYGIVNNNTDNVLIYQNNFLLPDAAGFNTDETMERGIYLTNSTGYLVEQNFFDGFNDFTISDDYPCALGVWVDNSGDASNEIRNNDFDEMKLGTYVTRQNRDFVTGVNGTVDVGGLDDQTGLQLFCNTYTNGQTDIFRDSETYMRWVQGGMQQDGTFQLTGNRFSVDDCSGVISDFVCDPYNDEHLDYWCHADLNTTPDCGGIADHPGYVGSLLTNAVSLVTYAEADCPNTFGGTGGGGQTPGGIGAIIAQLATVRNQLIVAKSTYNAVVDDNQKQSTLDILNEAFPHESQYYRDLLSSRYPLSDEVLCQLIAQSNRLSSWHLTEVFLANSPLRKEMLAQIERSQILSPFFMNFLYNADSGTSLRKLMEINITEIATNRDRLIQRIAQSGFTYESDSELETDQLIYLNDYLNQINQSDAVVMIRSRASLLASKGDYAGAIALVKNELSLTNYKKILEIEQSITSDWSLLSASQIAELWGIYNLPNDFSSSMALGILQEIGEADFEPEPRVPIQYRSMQLKNENEGNALPLLGVWPNPATEVAWLHYPIEADEHATIKVYDPQGRLLKSFQPNTNGLVELSLKNYESGIYVVQLSAFDKLVESIKLTVVNQK